MFRWIYGKSPLNAFVEKALHILKCAEPFRIFVRYKRMVLFFASMHLNQQTRFLIDAVHSLICNRGRIRKRSAISRNKLLVHIADDDKIIGLAKLIHPLFH